MPSATIWLCRHHRDDLSIREIKTLGHNGTTPCALCGATPAEIVDHPDAKSLHAAGVASGVWFTKRHVLREVADLIHDRGGIIALAMINDRLTSLFMNSPLPERPKPSVDKIVAERDALALRVMALEVERAWISCADQLPELEERVLFVTARNFHGSSRHCMGSRREWTDVRKPSGVSDRWDDDSDCDNDGEAWHYEPSEVTHWMPLPALPVIAT